MKVLSAFALIAIGFVAGAVWMWQRLRSRFAWANAAIRKYTAGSGPAKS